MKKLVLTVAAVFAFGFANAQDKKEDSGAGFSKGDLFVSGAVGFGSEKTGDLETSGFTFSPALGYFVTENIALGARLDFTSSTESEPGVDDTDTSRFGAEVFGRYYWTPASQFSVFGELAVGFGSNKVEQGPAEFKTKDFGINAGVGVNYFLSDNWSIEAGWAGLGYNTNDNGGDGAEKTNSFGLAIDLTAINFGLNYKF
ncbi:outer membrane protein [Flavobacterium sp.]|uniref:outer membrane protein n=1 Tax=Flavobacterium sp. TaxID=239 RepID=UPI002B4B70DB|nr:outer membrane beta-barrel protein [Flavobacterium sp.]HLP65362.1 outer membrane beta-barrel protein [Flavobacterium sp.]